MKNKRGWITILEATMAVLIVSSVLLVVYSKQADKGIGPEDYIFSLQKQVLMDISSRSDLRDFVLDEGEDSLDSLNDFVGGKIPRAYGYSLKVCDLRSNNYCKLGAEDIGKTKDKDLFVEQIIIASNGDNYDPKKVKLFIWENR